MNIQWDAEKFTADFSFVHRYGSALIDLLDAKENGTVLDLGCGNGALTKALEDRGWRAKGLDQSPELLAAARKTYPEIEFMEGDASDFRCSERFDAVFSNAVFHWIDRERQDRMLKCIHRALKKGGQLVFECGGAGNNQRIHEALAEVFSEHGYAYQLPFYFPSIGEYSPRLERNGFRVTYAVLFDRPTALKGENGMKDWIRMFVQKPFAGISAEESEAIADEASGRLSRDLYASGVWYADYVRLRIKAISL